MLDRVGQQLGKYHLLRLLGRGAFAAVYLGEHRHLERQDAIKVLDMQMEAENQESFRREASTIAQLKHPHIISVYDFDIEDQTPYLVMEYIPKGTLRSLHPRGTPLDYKQIVNYAKQIASALDYAHGQNVIHRDVKPENILLNAKNEVVLSDFGIAILQRASDTTEVPTKPHGTPIYMAPEQSKGRPSFASDQYAFGVMVYEWLCGEPPFRGSFFEVFDQHLHEPPPSLREHLPQLPLAVENVVFKALAKKPQQRFACVADFASALENAFEATQETPLEIGSHIGSNGELGVIDAPKPSPQEVFPDSPIISKQIRERLLDRVRSIWITGVLERSLHGAVLMTLRLQEEPGAIDNPWQLHVQHPGMAPRPLPTGTGIMQVYDEVGGELLILGAPGAGKTTLLLELTRDLLKRAERDEHHPIPMVFNLSSWVIRQQPLKDWLVKELNMKYQVPSKLGRTLVESNQILPLLDGLDEVAPKSRTACIDAINAYRQGEHGLLPLVVCSRVADYFAQNRRLLLHTAVAIQPLTRQQIHTYLAQGGGALNALRTVLRQDTTLYELASTPLMLNILTLTYHGMPVDDLLQRTTLHGRQQQIFNKYVQRMLNRRDPLKGEMPQQTVHWLTFLAVQMRKRNQTVFYLEQMQPDWLPTTQAYKRYAVLLPAIVVGMLLSLLVNALLSNAFDPARLIVSGFIGGQIGGLFGRTLIREQVADQQVRLLSSLARSLLIGFAVWLCVWLTVGQAYSDPGDLLHNGIITGLSSALSSFLLILFFQRSQRSYSSSVLSGFVSANSASWGRRLWQKVARGGHLSKGIGVGWRVGLAFGFGTGLLFTLEHGLVYGMTFGVRDGLTYGLAFGFISALLSIIFVRMDIKIHPIEVLTWSWRSLWKSLLSSKHWKQALFVGLGVGLGISLSFGLSTVFSHWLGMHNSGLGVGLVIGLGTGLGDGLAYGLAFAVAYGLLVGLWGGLSSEYLRGDRRIKPNEGIWRSLRISIEVGLFSGLVCGFVGILCMVLYYGLHAGLGQALNIGLIPGLRAGWSNALNIGLNTGLQVVGWQVALYGGLLACTLMGGLACFRHFVLRLLLWRSHKIPFKYAHFLTRATTCILLHKVGGSYKFIHDLLLEHFTSLEE